MIVDLILNVLCRAMTSFSLFILHLVSVTAYPAASSPIHAAVYCRSEVMWDDSIFMLFTNHVFPCLWCVIYLCLLLSCCWFALLHLWFVDVCNSFSHRASSKNPPLPEILPYRSQRFMSMISCERLFCAVVVKTDSRHWYVTNERFMTDFLWLTAGGFTLQSGFRLGSKYEI